MADPAPSIGHYQFGVFTVDVRAFELRKHGVRIKLQERPLQLLLILLERPGHTVTREDLRQRLWGDGTYVDFDHSISSAVNKLRVALSDSARTPRYIETVGRQGYRFIYPVAPHRTSLSVLPTPPRPMLLKREVRPRDKWLSVTLVAWLILAAIGIPVLLRYRAAAPGPIRSIAVLPLKNLSSDPEQEYFSEGLTDELIARLASLQGLRVISRTSVMQYRDSTKPLPQIARELGVDAVVEGSVLHAGDRVRITTQLIRAADDRHLWAQSYDRDERDILAVQNDVAREVADNIQLTLAAADRQKLATSRPIDHEAHELYLRGLYHWEKRSPDDIRASIGYFQKAIGRQPDYAAAYAGMANAYALLGGYTDTPQAGFVDQARAAAVKALEIDPQLARAHVSLAVIAQNYDWDWKTAESEYQKAIALDPNDATAHHWYGEFLGFQGRFDEAGDQFARAEQLDPLSIIIQTDHADLYYYSRQYDRAERMLLAVLARDPAFPRAHGILRGVYQAEGKYEASLADVNTFHGEGDATWHFASLCLSYAGMKDKRRARQALAQLEALGRNQNRDAGVFVYAYAGMGDKDRAFAWLERAYEQHSNIIAGLRVNPVYDPLRSDPRFRSLLQRVGLAQ